MRKGRGGKEKEWIDCAKSDAEAFDISGEWKDVVMEAGVWGCGLRCPRREGWRFTVTWRKEEDAAGLRQEKREANEARRVVTVQGSIEPPKRY